MDKKAFMRTLEASIAVITTLVFVLLINSKTPFLDPEPAENILAFLANDQDFRACLISNNETCINSSIREMINDKYDFNFNISKDPASVSLNLPKIDVRAESYFFAGNTTVYSSKVIRLFYWRR